LMMNPLYSSWNNALDYSRYPRGNTAPTVLPQMHYRYRGSIVHSVPSPRYYREIIPIPTVITAVTAVLPHSPLPCHSLTYMQRYTAAARVQIPPQSVDKDNDFSSSNARIAEYRVTGEKWKIQQEHWRCWHNDRQPRGREDQRGTHKSPCS